MFGIASTKRENFMQSKIIGLVEATASMSYKITGDAHQHSGMGKYETKDFFIALKASCMPEDREEVAMDLHSIAESLVMAKADYHANFLNQPPAPAIPMQQSVPATEPIAPAQPAPATVLTAEPSTAAPEAPTNPYPVAEKATAPATDPPAAKKQPAPSKVIADRLIAMGVTTDELIEWTRYKFPDITGKPTKEQYVESFTAAEEGIKANSVEQFKQFLADRRMIIPTQPNVSTETKSDVFTQDPAVVNALAQVSAKWPIWGMDLKKIGALWCADQVKDAEALGAFLITAGITPTTAPARIEAFLAITRHLAVSMSAVLIKFSKDSGNPMSMIEDELSKAIGQPIRFATDLPKDAVFNAFEAMRGQKK